MAHSKRNTVIAATKNKHKLQEIKKILSGSGIVVKSLSDFPLIPDIVENGKTLAANAAKKAETVMKTFGHPALSDDSGLFVPKLSGQPGVRSARYAGPACDYPANNRKLLQNLKAYQAKDRRAYFATVMAFAVPGRKTITRVGKIWGMITETAKGSNGFGYDPVFQPCGWKKTFAEMKAAEKNKISHRSLAVQKIAKVIRQYIIKKNPKNAEFT
ncbi:RdgB/HAM1 family non-canonical purine NTP pyrophosphatase [bacterium]|nr:RdgB/HAM1 family non-canonical purine NTP pyrophosphatase [bacterium]